MYQTLDPVCEQRIAKYGLQLRSNLPTQKFSKDASISRAQGNWAGMILTLENTRPGSVTYIFEFIRTHIYICIHTYLHTYMYAYIHTCMHTHIPAYI